MPKPPQSKVPSGSAQRPRVPVRSHDDTDLVLTPGGLRPRSLVHQLETGQHVSVRGGRVQIIETATGEVVRDLGEAGKPGEGEAEPPSSAPSAVPALPGLPDLGWIENSQWHNGGAQPIVYFSTKWVVPPAPASSDNQTVYLFNGMQPDSAAHILQPVLQWGPSPAGGGNYWSITNWYADGQGGAAAYQAPIRVNPGDVLQGVVACTGQSQSGTEFNYTSSFVGYPAADVTATDVDELTWAFETLECYGPYTPSTNKFAPLSQCSDYPNTGFTAMYDIEIKTGAPGTSGTDATIDWTPVTSYQDCGQNCVIVSNNSPGGAVYLYYQQHVVRTTYYDPRVAPPQWSEWIALPGADKPFGSSLAAVSSVPGGVSLFAIGQDGVVRTTYYDPRVAPPQWSEWIALTADKPFGSSLAAVSSVPGGVSLFAIGQDGVVRTTYYDPRVAPLQWSEWIALTADKPFGSSLAAVSSVPGGVSLFAIGQDGVVRTTYYDPRVGSPQWSEWIALNADEPLGYSLAAVSSVPGGISLFAIGQDR